ncbi:MAG: ABC transporter permease [Gemmataceae bacterium]|nr:ABC transporter permease [Gemmataceae bacterium]
MQFVDLVWLALAQLGKNKMRSGLTVLGVVIGIAAVTTMVSIGQGASQLIQNQFQNLGSSVIIVLPASSRSRGVVSGTVPTLTAGDAAAIASECPSVRAVTPLLPTSAQVIGGNVNHKPNDVQGVGADYLLVRNWPLEAGEFLSERDVTGANKVCVIGATVALKLFPDVEPVGQTIRIKNVPFKVIGLLGRKGANLVGADQDDIVVLPYTTMKKRLQGSTFPGVGALMVSAKSDEVSKQAEREIRDLLLQRHRIPLGQPADFEIQNATEIAAAFGVVTGAFTAMLAAIAGISLLVGGVGIMNIMLVSVTERTREIGIRMALGARPRDILRQFLVEAVVLATIGGALGVGLGLLASWGAVALINAVLPSGNWPFVASVPAALVALAFSAAVGVFFGYYPARRASRLDPIDALRYE